MEKVRAAVLYEVGGSPKVEEIDLAPPGPGQVRVELGATGVCHSDLSLSNGTMTCPLPVILGHEGAGVIVETGADVTRFAAGDRVVLNWAPPCRTCWFCEHGQPYLCQNAGRAWRRTHARLPDGSEVYPGLGVGGFATQTVVDADACIPLPDGVPMAEAALLGCAVLTGAGAALRAAKVQPGESVVVFGLGGVGLSAVQGARIAGAEIVIGVDPMPAKAELARRLGAAEVLAPGPDLTEQIRGLTGGRGADHAIECVGRGDTIRTAWSCTRRGGSTTVVGMGSRTDQFSFNALEIAHFGRTLRGCIYGSTDPAVDIPFLIERFRDGSLDLRGMISQEIELGDVGTAFDRLAAGSGARNVIVFT
jgi:S-(hydroxymethyl)glutathione dehydrogenase/alcohol dehydrogenase